MTDDWTDIIRQVHASSRQCVLCATGGGASAIGSLLSLPGGSRSVLEAVVPYAPPALDEWLRRKPDSYCSRETSLSMATAAWARASHLANARAGLVGVSCTASLASDRPKKGSHRCFVAAQTEDATRCYALTLQKGARDRAAEEAVVANVILLAVAEACGVVARPALSLLGDEMIDIECEIGPAPIRDVWTGALPLVWSGPRGELSTERPSRPIGLLSGAFNPLHHGHERLARAAEARLGGDVAFEMPIVNADKPRLDYLSIESRRRQFQTRPLALTAAPLFVDKARLFPRTTFVVGFDTAERLLDPRFYGHSEVRMTQSFTELRELGCRFLVAGRLEHGQFETLTDLAIPAELSELFDGLTETDFRDDISSTELRHATQHECE